MQPKQEKIQPGWMIPKKIKKAFDDFCVERGAVAQHDCAGALFLWLYMPARIREWAKLSANGQSVIPEEFWIGLGAELDRSLQAQLDSLPANPPEKRKKA